MAPPSSMVRSSPAWVKACEDFYGTGKPFKPVTLNLSCAGIDAAQLSFHHSLSKDVEASQADLEGEEEEETQQLDDEGLARVRYTERATHDTFQREVGLTMGFTPSDFPALAGATQPTHRLYQKTSPEEAVSRGDPQAQKRPAASPRSSPMPQQSRRAPAPRRASAETDSETTENADNGF